MKKVAGRILINEKIGRTIFDKGKKWPDIILPMKKVAGQKITNEKNGRTIFDQ